MEIDKDFTVKQEGSYSSQGHRQHLEDYDDDDPLKCDVDIKSEEIESLQACTICKRQVPDSEFWGHVFDRHGLNNDEYQGVASALKTPKVFEDADASGDDDEFVEKVQPAEDQLTNGCTFKCKYCDLERISWQQISKHIYQTHKDVKDEKIDPFELVIDHKIFECSKCKKPILQDKLLIRRHMRQAHKIFLPKHKKVKKEGKHGAKKPWVVGNECKFKCKYCQKVLDNWGASLKHHGMP